MEERTGWRGQNESQIGGEEKRNGRLVGVAETSKERAEWRRLQGKNLNLLGPPKRKEWSHCHKESSWQIRRSRLGQNEKEQSRPSRIPDYGWGGKRVKMGKSHTLARESGIRARAWSEKGGLHGEPKQISRRKGRARKMSLPRRSKRKHEQVNGRRSSPGRSAESWFHSKSGQT